MLRLKTMATLLTLAAIAVSFSVMSADHAESPGADADFDADLADVFLFPSPESPTKMIGSITWAGRAAPRSRVDGTFSCPPKVLFTFNVDRADATGVFDSVPDLQVFARLGLNSAGKCGIQFENIPGAGGTFSGPVETVFQAPNGNRAFAGLRNDPFFFDVEGYAAMLASFSVAGQNGDLVNSFKLGGTQPRRDSFALRNVSAMVFEMDLDVLAPKSASGVRPKLRAWAITGRLVE